MGQVFSRHGMSILGLIAVIGIDVHLIQRIKPHFQEAPSTEVWFCLSWMAMVTEAGFGIIWYKVNPKKWS